MDYKRVLEDCNARAKLYKQQDAVWNLLHERQCADAITGLLARAEAAEAKCKRLDESRERANESAHMWESRCKMLEEQTAAPAEVLEAIDGLIEFARERMSITDWLYYVNVIGPWRGEKEE